MSVTRAAGFSAAALAAGLKSSGKTDLALVVNSGPDFAAAGVFTRNRVKAAPVLWSEQALADGRARAVILNSGGANACTARWIRRHASDRRAGRRRAVGPRSGFRGVVPPPRQIGAVDVAVCSTGLIGLRLPMDKISAGITELVPH
jgi:glutamate N-acetyltransferase/amino-acid N-acetyltransferase